jgi:excisionase family DNA binding protein
MAAFEALTDIRKELRELKAIALMNVRANDTTMNYAEAAAYLKIEPRTLQNRVYKGQVPCIRDGKTVIFYKSDLDRYLEMRRAV